MKFFLSLLLFSQVALFGAIDFSVFDPYQERWTRDEVELRLIKYLQKGERLASYYTLDDDKLTLYNAPEVDKEREVEYELKLARARKSGATHSGRKNLVGVKIAIDPGHLGGPYARLEERYIDIPPSLERESQIQFNEGTLSFLTAIYLKVLLEKEGAIVMITRDQIGKGVYEVGFFDWLKQNPSLWAGEVSLSKLFRKYYNPLDLRARAEKINEFGPDLSIVIHYNSHHVEAEYSSNNCVSPNNYNMVFIPGAFCRGELVTQENRFDFMRLIATEDLTGSAHLSKAILEAFGKHLQLPTVTKADGARYLETVCLKVDEGIYARNLALTRMIQGPLCYGETLIQNNIDECLNLSREDFIIDGRPCSSRVKSVAEAYFEGIKWYLLKTN